MSEIDDALKEIRDLLLRLDIRVELLARTVADLEHQMVDKWARLESAKKYETYDPRQWKIEKRFRQPTLKDDYEKWRLMKDDDKKSDGSEHPT